MNLGENNVKKMKILSFLFKDNYRWFWTPYTRGLDLGENNVKKLNIHFLTDIYR